jgi:hypothetical protein
VGNPRMTKRVQRNKMNGLQACILFCIDGNEFFFRLRLIGGQDIGSDSTTNDHRT